MKKRTAFSLFELSVVIIIIGLLIVGTMKGARILNLSRLQSAQTLTLSSVGKTLIRKLPPDTPQLQLHLSKLLTKNLAIFTRFPQFILTALTLLFLL